MSEGGALQPQILAFCRPPERVLDPKPLRLLYVARLVNGKSLARPSPPGGSPI